MGRSRRHIISNDLSISGEETPAAGVVASYSLNGPSLDRALAQLLASGDAPASMPPSAIEWHAIGAHSVRSDLGGLLLEAAARRGWHIPEDVAASCRRGASRVAARNRELMTELEKVLLVLRRAGVEAILLKGAALNLTLYDGASSGSSAGDDAKVLASSAIATAHRAVAHDGRAVAHVDRALAHERVEALGLRPMSDLDLLVKPGDTDTAIRALRKSGAQCGPALSVELFPDYYYETELWRGAARIDLHVRALRPMRVARFMPDDALWDGAERLQAGSASAWIPSNEGMLLHLMAHAAFHGFDRLIWHYDIHRWAVERRDRIDWALFMRRAADWRLTHVVRLATGAVESMFGSTFPSTVHEKPVCAARGNWRDRLVAWHAPRDAGSPLGHVVVNLLTTPGLRHRAGYLARLLSPRTDRLASVYPFRHPGWTACAAVWRVARRLIPRFAATGGAV